MASFSALDLLSMPDSEQQILRCLSQHPQLTIVEISAITKLSVKDLETTLDRLVHESRLNEQLRDGQRAFSVHFSREMRRPVHNLLDDFLSFSERSDDAR